MEVDELNQIEDINNNVFCEGNENQFDYFYYDDAIVDDNDHAASEFDFEDDIIFDDDDRADSEVDFEAASDNDGDSDYNLNDDSGGNLLSTLRLMRQTIYENSSVTLLEATIAINVFIERFNISDIGTNGLLKLLQFLLPPSNNLPKTKKRLKKLFCNVDDIKINKHCSKCMGIVVDKVCNNISCIEYEAACEIDTFTFCKIKSQIENILQYYHDTLKGENMVTDDTLDITNSSYYKNLKTNQNQPSINLMISTDGISLVKSANLNTWPVSCSILEFPNRLRNSIFNCLISGMSKSSFFLVTDKNPSIYDCVLRYMVW